MLTIIYLSCLLNTSPPWIVTRAAIYAINHDHPSVEYPKCRRDHSRAVCKARWRAADRKACEYIVREGCEKI
jgi:hypothetical protein